MGAAGLGLAVAVAYCAVLPAVWAPGTAEGESCAKPATTTGQGGAAAAGASSDDAPSPVRVLSAERRVFLVEDFLTEQEINHVISVAAEHFTAEMGGSTAWRTAGQYMSTELRSWADDTVLRGIEERIARWVKIPVHAGESALMVGYTPPARQSASEPSGHRRLLENVHHDTNTAPHRVMTSLIYLTEVADGGETVFPGLTADPNAAEPDAVAGVRGALEDAFHAGERILFAPPDRGCFNASLFAKCEAQCRAGSAALSIRPRRGSSVFFASAGPDGVPDPAMWHGGCEVRSTGGKWTQKANAPVCDCKNMCTLLTRHLLA